MLSHAVTLVAAMAVGQDPLLWNVNMRETEDAADAAAAAAAAAAESATSAEEQQRALAKDRFVGHSHVTY